MIKITYLQNSPHSYFDFRKKCDIDRYLLGFGNCPCQVEADGYELGIISNWKNIPMTNNAVNIWSGDMAWFIAINMTYSLQVIKKEGY